MSIAQMLRGDSSRNAKLYLAIGVLSLIKAIVVRNDRRRFRRELLDAGLFLAVGAILHRYSALKAEKKRDLSERLPAWIPLGEPEPTSTSQRVRDRLVSTGAERSIAGRARRRLERTSEPESVGDRVRRAMAEW